MTRRTAEHLRCDRDRAGSGRRQPHRPGLYRAVESMREVLVNSKISQWLAFAFVPTGCVFSHNVNVFALDSRSCFCSLQSRVHEIWVRFTASTLEDRLGYRRAAPRLRQRLPAWKETSLCPKCSLARHQTTHFILTHGACHAHRLRHEHELLQIEQRVAQICPSAQFFLRINVAIAARDLRH